MDQTYDSLQDLSLNGSYKNCDSSISDQLADFSRLRISALTKAAEMSPLVKEVTIGPNSPIKKQEIVIEDAPKNIETFDESLVEDKVREDLRFTLLMKNYDNKLKESAEELFNDLIEQMITNRADAMKKFSIKLSDECNRRTLEGRVRKMELLKSLQDNDNSSLLEQAKQDELQSQILKKQNMENMNRILEEQNRATARFASITDSHTKICICYNELTNLLQTEPLAKVICDKYITAINAVISTINSIMESCKSGSITDKEVKQAEVLSVNVENIKKKIFADLDLHKKQEIQKLKELEEAKKKEQEMKKAEEQKAVEIAQAQKQAAASSKKSTKPMFYSSKNYSNYEELKTFLESYESQYKDLLENTNMKKFRFDCQKAVNTPVNALSSVSGSHIRDKYDKLYKLLKGERVQVLDTYVTATQHPQGLYYCTALLAKKIVRQGDLLVSSNPEAAFPLAAVTAALWSQFPIFGKLLEANFYRQCPYLVPMFLPQKEGQTDKEFYLSRGYTYNEEGVVEKQDKFLKRMSGIFRLNCAIWIALTPRFINTVNPHGICYAWRWLASFINLRPEPDICATLLHDFFSVCGSEFFKNYGKQFVKVIKLITTDYLAILQDIDEGGPKTRLEVFLQNVLKTGQISPPSGLLPPNTW
ncbi:mRNA export factor Gle1 [Ostrinia nubilalis]|uniref:nucleoporin GLE1 n=1 Tax=Ostrinia furnacalis TaxID=93504 RepID=UPI00103F6959|nr:nucleoporin GLE1 [Ostrinia furnacalis]